MNLLEKLKDSREDHLVEFEEITENEIVVKGYKIVYLEPSQKYVVYDKVNTTLVDFTSTDYMEVARWVGLKVCPCCDRIFDTDIADYDLVEEDCVCQDCIDSGDEITRCGGCGKLIWRDNAQYGSDDDVYCESCFDDIFTYCDLCDNVMARDDANTVIEYDEDGHSIGSMCVCDDCIDNDDDIYFCDDCGEYFIDTHEHHVVSDYNEHFCPNCRPYISTQPTKTDDGKLTIYHEVDCYHPDIKLTPISHKNKVEDIKKFKGYGIELEVDKEDGNESNRLDQINTICKLNEIAGGHMYFSEDGSLDNGFEIVTQPHTENAMKSINWKDYLQVLKDAGYVEESTTAGYHIHISRKLFGDTLKAQNDNIAKLIYFFENNKNDLVTLSRRVDTYWCPFYQDEGGLFPSDDGTIRYNRKLDIKSKKDYETISNKSDRSIYRIRGAVNLGRDDAETVEIRLFRSTLNYDDFMASFDFVTTLVKNIKKITWKDIDDKSKWLANASDDLKKYFVKKGVFVCA